MGAGLLFSQVLLHHVEGNGTCGVKPEAPKKRRMQLPMAGPLQDLPKPPPKFVRPPTPPPPEKRPARPPSRILVLGSGLSPGPKALLGPKSAALLQLSDCCSCSDP